MNIRRRLRAGGAALVLASLMLGMTACVGTDAPESPPPAQGQALSGNLDVRVYGDWPFVKRNAESFMKEHPDVTIKVGGIDNEELRQQGGRIFTSDDAPDVVSHTLNDVMMEDWIEAGALLQLDDMWQSGNLESVHPKSVIDQATAADGKRYSVPLGLTIAPQVFYNAKALQDAGVTAPAKRSFGSLQEFEQGLAALKRAGFDQPLSAPGGALVELMFMPLLASSCGSETYVRMAQNWQQGAEGAPKYTDPCAVRALEVIKRWADAGYLPKGYAAVTYDQAVGLFEQDSGMWVSGSWAPPVYKPPFQWDWAVFPPVPGGSATPMGIGVDSFLIPAKAKNPAVAKAFIDYMISKEVLEQKMGRVPARTDVDLAKVIGDNPVEIAIAKETPNFEQVPLWGVFVPVPVIDALTSAVADGLIGGRMSVQQAAQALQSAVDDYRE